MKKIIYISLVIFTLIFSIPKEVFAFKELPSSTPFPSSYELFYPVVAGKIPGDKFYKLKSFKESFIGKLIFGSTKKADYHLVLSKKRLVEAEDQIIKNKDFSEIDKSLTKVIEEITKAIEISKKTKGNNEQFQDITNNILSVTTNETDFIEKTLVRIAPKNYSENLLKYSRNIHDLTNKIN